MRFILGQRDDDRIEGVWIERVLTNQSQHREITHSQIIPKTFHTPHLLPHHFIIHFHTKTPKTKPYTNINIDLAPSNNTNLTIIIV